MAAKSPKFRKVHMRTVVVTSVGRVYLASHAPPALHAAPKQSLSASPSITNTAIIRPLIACSVPSFKDSHRDNGDEKHSSPSVLSKTVNNSVLQYLPIGLRLESWLLHEQRSWKIYIIPLPLAVSVELYTVEYLPIGFRLEFL